MKKLLLLIFVIVACEPGSSIPESERNKTRKIRVTLVDGSKKIIEYRSRTPPVLQIITHEGGYYLYNSRENDLIRPAVIDYEILN